MKIQNVIRNIFTKYNKNLRTVSAVKTSQYGRSMIEMLGVLAIVGVLSVGGIAGYSKAMEMFKANKIKQQLNQIFYQFIYQMDDWKRIYDSGTKVIEIPKIWQAMGNVPDGMRAHDKFYLSDQYQNKYFLNYSGEKYIQTTLASTSKSFNKKLCINILEIANNYKEDIWQVQIRDKNTEGKEAKYQLFPKNNFTPVQMNDFCSKCVDGGILCNMLIFFNKK